LSSTGRVENGKLIADADITRLTGELRSYPVSLKSRLGWRDEGLDIERFDFRSGTSQVSAKGRLGETLKLDWAIAASNLAELYPRAQGQLKTDGTLTGPRTAPTIQVSFSSEALALPDYRIGKLDGKISVDLFRWQQLDIDLTAQALELGDYAWQSLDVSNTGQQIELKAVSEKLTALAVLESNTDTSGWHGRLLKFELDGQPDYNWQLKAPASFDVTEKHVQSQPVCLRSADGEACIELQRQNTLWQAKLDAGKIPLTLLTPWLPADLTLDGNFNATAALKFQAPDQLLGQINIELLPGTVSYPLLEGERDRWDYRGGTVAVSLSEQGVIASTEIAMGNGDRLHINTELPGANLFALDHQRQTLHADAELSVHDLGLIEAMLLEVQDLKGNITLNLTASGTLARPRLSGEAHLLGGALRIPRLGLNIHRLELNGKSQTVEKFNFDLKAYSGDGNLLIRGQTQLDASKGWPTEINISGNAFEASRIPEAQVQISPDLKVNIQHHTIAIQGDIHIPYAKLQPKDITTAARVSEDVEIVGGTKSTAEAWLLDTRIRLTLGERVHFYGFGFEGRLEGSLLLEDIPGNLTRATGEINIPEGRYRAYGQRLDIELGRLLFTGGLLTNPGLDLRAVRHIGNITTGLKVRGSLNQPQMELFSNPAMGQTDALAYLLLGAPIENASGEQGAMMAKAALALSLSGGDHLARTLGDRFGLDEMRVESSDEGDQASLVVGRYLSPKLYVSYGVGLIEAFNTLTLRYKIADKWQLKAESGEYQGADILYTIER